MRSAEGPLLDSVKMERERMRATLSIGAIALAYYLKQSWGITIEISTIPLGLEKLLPWAKPVMIDVTVSMVTLFGAYILGMVIGLSKELVVGKRWQELCQFAQGFGYASYLLGALLLVAVGVYFFGTIALFIAIVTYISKFIRFVKFWTRQQ